MFTYTNSTRHLMHTYFHLRNFHCVTIFLQNLSNTKYCIYSLPHYGRIHIHDHQQFHTRVTTDRSTTSNQTQPTSRTAQYRAAQYRAFLEHLITFKFEKCIAVVGNQAYQHYHKSSQSATSDSGTASLNNLLTNYSLKKIAKPTW